MIEYIIDWLHTGGYYSPSDKTIAIGNGDYNKLSKQELSTYLSDTIIHEYTHHLMHKYFNGTISKLFDAISHNFRDMTLLHKLIDNDVSITHDEVIKKHGIEFFLWNSGIDKELFNTAKKLCNKGTKKEYDWVEIFGLPRYRKLQNETPENIIRIYPNHVILKIEVI